MFTCTSSIHFKVGGISSRDHCISSVVIIANNLATKEETSAHYLYSLPSCFRSPTDICDTTSIGFHKKLGHCTQILVLGSLVKLEEKTHEVQNEIVSKMTNVIQLKTTRFLALVILNTCILIDGAHLWYLCFDFLGALHQVLWFKTWRSIWSNSIPVIVCTHGHTQ